VGSGAIRSLAQEKWAGWIQVAEASSEKVCRFQTRALIHSSVPLLAPPRDLQAPRARNSIASWKREARSSRYANHVISN